MARKIVGPLVQRTIRVCVPAIVIWLAVAGGFPAVAQTWTESVTAYERGDYAIAYRGFRLHAEQGDAGAQYYLGLMYLHGDGVPKNYTKAADWYRRAAEQGVARAQYYLGLMYVYGFVVPQNYTKAADWYRRAAEQGAELAQFNLGVMYYNGEGVPQDYTRAAQWFRRAAEQAYAPAQLRLGHLYYDGWGIPQDYVQSHKWFSLAASDPSASRTDRVVAFSFRDMVELRMGPEQLAHAQRLAGEWKPRYEDADLPSSSSPQLYVADSPAPSSAQIKTGSFTYDDGSSYEGEFEDGKVHGQGTYSWSDGTMYQGAFESGLPHGEGRQTWPSGATYEGNFTAGRINGYGTLTLPDGTTYTGDFVDERREGTGMMMWPTGATYEGNFTAGRINGHGTLTWPDGTTYTGDFVDERREGTGTLTLPDATTYTGDFVDEELEGTGMMMWPTGATYEGNFTAGRINGHGTLTWPDGTTYTGDFVDERREGTGTLTLPDATTYMGDFVDEEPEGTGTITWPDGSTYSGIFDRRAAEQGNAFAQLSLGILYYYGLDVPQDDVEAHKWFNIAASRLRDSERRAIAIRYREQVASRLSSSQLARAFRLAREWQPTEESDSPSPRDSQLRIPDSRPPAHLDRAMTGSGFRVSADGHILTNAHVVRGCAEVRAPTGMSVRVVAYDDAADLALLESSSRSPDAVAAFRQGRGIRSGASVVVVGHPLHGILASEASVSAGIVSALAGPGDDRRLIQITAPVQPGNSGGPVLDSAGNVIGVVVARLDVLKVGRDAGYLPQNVNFAVAAGAARAFLDAEGVPYLTSPSQRALPTDQVAATGKRFTVLVECWKPRT